MPKAPTTPTSYNRLVKTLQQEIKSTKTAIEQQLVVCYWNMGKRIALYLDKDAAHGSLAALSKKLSKDTDICQRTLEHCHQFYSVYPRINFKAPINWSQYRYLIAIPDQRERDALAQKIIRENLNSLEVKALISARTIDISPGQKLDEPSRGLLYHYRIIKSESDQEDSKGFMVDIGFANRIVPPAHHFKLSNTRIVSSAKTKSGYGIVCANVTKEKIYTYKAVPKRVIDADTIFANVDCGFGLWTEQRLRLKGIDAPEKRTTAGIQAFEWVQKRLKGCPFVIIKTYKSDKYDRYLADIFYLKNENDPHAVAQKGLCLNTQLVKEGLARVWEGAFRPAFRPGLDKA